jgi:predicted RNA-binding Zn ribbon-like protein
VGGAHALDFLNSIASPLDVPVEWLASGDDLVNWLAQSQLVAPDVLARVRKTARQGELDRVAAQARALRDWFRGFVVSHKGKRLTPAVIRQLGPLNRLLARDEVHGQVVLRPRGGATSGASGASGASTLVFVADRHQHSADSLLQPLAWAMANLLTDVDFRHVKACEWHTCSLLFVDTTKGRMRRWCSMAVCGNRAKQAAHRERSAGVAKRS